MEHLSQETLARLVDSPPDAEERVHLERCAPCSRELDALRAQTEALGALPELLPPPGQWDALEARLRSEGLMRTPAHAGRWVELARTPGWMRAAAAVLLFLGGTATGVGMTTVGPLGPDAAASAGAVDFADASLEGAAERLRAAEAGYVDALARYRALMEQEGGGVDVADPTTRFAALEYLVAAGQAAVRQAPADPFLNGLLASTIAEREVALRRISSSGDAWF